MIWPLLALATEPEHANPKAGVIHSRIRPFCHVVWLKDEKPDAELTSWRQQVKNKLKVLITYWVEGNTPNRCWSRETNTVHEITEIQKQGRKRNRN